MENEERQYWKNKFLTERKEFITYTCENDGLYICDNRFRYTITQCKTIKRVKNEDWETAYNFLKNNKLLKDKEEKNDLSI